MKPFLISCFILWWFNLCFSQDTIYNKHYVYEYDTILIEGDTIESVDTIGLIQFKGSIRSAPATTLGYSLHVPIFRKTSPSLNSLENHIKFTVTKILIMGHFRTGLGVGALFKKICFNQEHLIPISDTSEYSLQLIDTYFIGSGIAKQEVFVYDTNWIIHYQEKREVEKQSNNNLYFTIPVNLNYSFSIKNNPMFFETMYAFHFKLTENKKQIYPVDYKNLTLALGFTKTLSKEIHIQLKTGYHLTNLKQINNNLLFISASFQFSKNNF